MPFPVSVSGGLIINATDSDYLLLFLFLKKYIFFFKMLFEIHR